MDLALDWTTEGGDLVLAGGDLATEGGLRSAVIISLMTDRRADADDVLPDGSDDRRGSWHDSFLDNVGDLEGSRLWLLSREKTRQAVLDAARDYALEALQWLIDDGIAASVDVQASFVDHRTLGLSVDIRRPRVPEPMNVRLQFVWEGL